MKKIRIGIAGYGNLGKGVEMAIRQNEDMELAGVFTRRDPATVTVKTPGVKAYTMEDAKNMKDQIDVMIICGGSATDLPKQTPELAKDFNVIDSFDTHATILIESGADVKDVQTRLGHANIQTTLQTYVHDTEAMANRSVDIFEQAIEQKKLS